MKAYTLIISSFICCIRQYTAIDIMPELKRNISNFGYRINFKYEGKLSYLYDRFYVVTKFILPTIEDIKIPWITFDTHCSYLNANWDKNKYLVQHVPYIRNFCSKIVPFIY